MAKDWKKAEDHLVDHMSNRIINSMRFFALKIYKCKVVWNEEEEDVVLRRRVCSASKFMLIVFANVPGNRKHRTDPIHFVYLDALWRRLFTVWSSHRKLQQRTNSRPLFWTVKFGVQIALELATQEAGIVWVEVSKWCRESFLPKSLNAENLWLRDLLSICLDKRMV